MDLKTIVIQLSNHINTLEIIDILIWKLHLMTTIIFIIHNLDTEYNIKGVTKTRWVVFI